MKKASTLALFAALLLPTALPAAPKAGSKLSEGFLKKTETNWLHYLALQH